MSTYVVKNGENILDVAMKLYGGIEGIFDLLVCNQDAVEETGLSLNDTLEPGMELEYTDGFTVNADLVSWFDSNGIKVLNGEHVYTYYEIGSYVPSYFKQLNLSVIDEAFGLYPSIEAYPDCEQDDIDNFLIYINENSMWMADLREADITDLIADRESYARVIMPEDDVTALKVVVQQTGIFSTMQYALEEDRIIVIDWGDNTPPEITYKTGTVTKEHCYDDAGSHVIKIYGDLGFTLLDLRGIGGTYYLLDEVQVSGDFYSDETNTTINRLITKI